MKPIASAQGVLTCILARHASEALALGRSLKLNSPDLPSVCVYEGDLPPEKLSALRTCFSDVIRIRPEHERLGWLVKHVMAVYSPFEHTLFVDSDCLVLRDLRPAFVAAGARSIAFATKSEPAQETGETLYAGISLDYLLRRFSVDWWPQILGGGHFFFHNTAEARRLFERARDWGAPERICEFGWTDRTRVAPDELTLQIALVEAGLGRACALVDYPLVCWTPWERARPDVFTGRISLRAPDTGIRRKSDHFFIAHFGGDTSNPNYHREQWRLRLWDSAFASLTHRALASATKPFLHAGAHTARKSRHAWHRLQRVVATKR
ncbi:MAG TPA: hypothetical protein VIT91_10110 [Chthoniobacterales bacterium]